MFVLVLAAIFNYKRVFNQSNPHPKMSLFLAMEVFRRVGVSTVFISPFVIN